MNVTLTVGGGSCRHITVTDQAGTVLGHLHRDRLDDVDVDGEPAVLNRVREFVRRYRRANPGATPAQIRTAVQAEDF